MKKGITTFVSILLLLLCWQLTAWLVQIPDLIPTVPVLIKTLVDLFLSPSFYLSVTATLLRGLVGMFLSLLAAGGLSFLFARHRWLYELFRPVIIIMRSVPVISFILLALIFLNPESLPLVIGFLTMFPLLTENLTKGIQSLRPALECMARQFRIGRWNKITQVLYPQLQPFLYSGLASASGFGWRAIIMGEVLSQCDLGIGSEMKRAQIFIEVPQLMAWTLIAILISFLFDKGIGWLGKQSLPVSFAGKAGFPPVVKSDIELNHVSYRYKKKQIFSGFSYTFESGQIYGISAPSGTGKTTLLNLINGTLKPADGFIRLHTGTGIASVFQEPELLPGLTVLENISLPLASYADRKVASEQARFYLSEMELDDYADNYPDELSFGQQQRVAIARAMAYPSPYLLMDEPFKGLDEALSDRIIVCIRHKQQTEQQTILFTSHKAEELNRLAEHILYLGN